MSVNYRSRRRRLVAVSAALVLVAAACGGDDESTSSTDAETTETSAAGDTTAPTDTSASETTEGGSGAAVRGVTDTEITIAGLAALTSPQGGYPGVDLGAQARFERANRDGGIHGRTINFIGVEDDGEDAAANLDLVRKLVQQDEVFAIAPVVGQGLYPQSSDFLAEQKVPFVGWGFMPGYCANAWGFGFNGCLSPPEGGVSNTSLSDTLVEALDMGEGDTVAVIGYDADAGRAGNIAVVGAFENAGVEVVLDDATVPVTDTTDFTPWVQRIMTAADGQPPTAVAMITLFNNTVGLTGALRAAGYEGATLNYLTYVPGLLEAQPQLAAALEGSYVNTQWLPEEFGGEAIDTMKADLEAIGADPTIGFATSIGYWSADLLIQMLDAVGPDLSPETFDAVINGEGFTYEPLGDPSGIGPVSFPQDHDQPTPCAAMVQIQGTSYEPIVPLTCYEVISLD